MFGQQICLIRKGKKIILTHLMLQVSETKQKKVRHKGLCKYITTFLSLLLLEF